MLQGHKCHALLRDLSHKSIVLKIYSFPYKHRYTTMLILIQRVKQAEVHIAENTVGAISKGLLVFVCAEPTDTSTTLDNALKKIINLRIFADAEGKMNLNVQQINGGILLVSQFTLAADTQRGNRPSFTKCAPPDLAEQLYDQFISKAKAAYPQIATGQFGADMDVHLINDGPVTIPMQIN